MNQSCTIIAFLSQFLLIFRKAAAGELEQGSGLYELYQRMSEIDVDVEGVKGAANFFQAKVNIVCRQDLGVYNREIRQFLSS